MKLLHTADWHIGKVLHKQSLAEEQALFLDWLIDLINKEKIDVLLISGDVFDHSNPSVKDRQLYYTFLKKLINTQTQIIITGGNHDSIAVLNGPKDILEMLQVHIVGGATANLEDELIEIRGKDNQLELVVAAVPFLRDKDLRTLQHDQSFQDKTEAVRAGICHHYEAIANLCQQKYPDTSVVAMGHLYARGVSISESEREIHVGNSAAITADVFSDVFDYVALGHIHQPQIINKNPMIRYSGSPVALSFSEKKDEKIVLVVDFSRHSITIPKPVKVPQFRALKKLSGTFAQVQQQLSVIEKNHLLPTFVELEVCAPKRDIDLIAQVDEFVFEYAKQDIVKILKHRIDFEQEDLSTADLFREGIHIEDLKVEDVFAKRLDSLQFAEAEKAEMIELFGDLLETYYQKEPK